MADESKLPDDEPIMGQTLTKNVKMGIIFFRRQYTQSNIVSSSLFIT